MKYVRVRVAIIKIQTRNDVIQMIMNAREFRTHLHVIALNTKTRKNDNQIQSFIDEFVARYYDKFVDDDYNFKISQLMKIDDELKLKLR